MAKTLSEVAKISSLSQETILEALVSPSSLEPEVVRYVMKRLLDSGYLEIFKPWKLKKRDTAIALLTPTIESASSVETYKGVERAMSALGITTTIVSMPTRSSSVTRESILKALLPFNMIDAVICLNIVPDDETYEKYLKIGKPLVLVETRKSDYLSVLIESEKGISIGMNYLFSKGYRRIGLMNGPTKGSEVGTVPSERLLAYVSSLHRLGLTFDESLIHETKGYDPECGIAGFEYFASLSKMPEAVFCASGDMTAIGLMNAARNNGMRVPEDFAVLGYDDMPVASVVYPALSTIRQRHMIAGAAALVMALESVLSTPSENLVIMPELIQRGSA